MTSLIGLRRRVPRKTCSVEARMLIAGRPSVPCTVRDVTPDGAKLVADEKIGATDKILLLIPALAEVWAAEVRWRRGLALGVKFVRGEADLPGADGGAPDNFALRLQTAQLARTVKRLASA
ncbi:MAG: PilZ domain-containing protein [Methylovirgula sp.]